jgi:polyhydroxyalkanoate synthesis regulator phasin
VDAPGNEPDRSLLESFALAALGAVALTAERADELATSLAERGGMRREDARALIDDTLGRWRGDASRLRESAGANLERWAKELGLVTRDEWDELELRVAQIEHRLKLVEGPPRAVPPPAQH